MQSIIEDEWRDMEESLNELTQRGVLTADAAERLMHTATLVYRGGKCPQVTLGEADLEDTEGIARMDVVVRGPEGSGGFAAWHITGSARRDISRVMENNPEAQRHWKEPTAEAEDAAVEEAEEEMIEEEVEEETTMEGDPTAEGAPSVEQQNIARRARIHFAEYRMFRAKAQRCTEATTWS